MDNEEKVLRKLLAVGEWFNTKQLDAVLLEVWGNAYDAGMHCNSLMKRGFIRGSGENPYFCNQKFRQKRAIASVA